MFSIKCTNERCKRRFINDVTHVSTISDPLYPLSHLVTKWATPLCKWKPKLQKTPPTAVIFTLEALKYIKVDWIIKKTLKIEYCKNTI